MAIVEHELTTEHSARNTEARDLEPDTFEFLPLKLIQPSPLNPRDLFEETALGQLAASIKERGVLEPILVRLHVQTEADGGTGYEIIAGERRFRAAQMAGLKDIPAIVKDVPSDRDALELTLIENLYREDINALERAQGFHSLSKLGWKQEIIAEKFHTSQAAISNSLRLLKLPDDIQDMVRAGRLSQSHAMLLLPVLEHMAPNVVIDMAGEAADLEWSVKRLQEFIGERYPAPLKAAAPTLMDVPAQEARFVPPEPQPLSPQGDMTDEQWETSAKVRDAEGALAALNNGRDETVAEWEQTDADAQSLRTDQLAKDVAAEPANTTRADDVPPAADAGDLEQAAEDAAPSTDAVSPAHAPVAAQPIHDAAGTSAKDVPVSPAQRDSVPAPPVATTPKPATAPAAKPAESVPNPAPAAPPSLPAGLMRAVVNKEAYEQLDAQGLWPLEYAVEEIAILRAKASMPMHPESIKAGELLEQDAASGGVLTPPETEILHQLYPDRNIVTWVMLAGALLVRRAQSLNLMPAADLLPVASTTEHAADPLDAAVNVTPGGPQALPEETPEETE